MNGALSLIMPPSISAYAHQVDLLALAFLVLMVLFTAPVFVVILIFTVRYRKGSKASRDHRPRGSTRLELGWMIVPFIAACFFYVWAAHLFYLHASPPDGALQVDVVAKQWMWKFEHPGGQREINELHVPADRPVVLKMISQDVIHDLFLPALRIKQDVLPGRYSQQWFQADETGIYPFKCAEFCGTEHAQMIGKLIIMPPGDYARWLEENDTSSSLIAQGADLYRRYGCSGCHGPSATVHAPPLAGLYGRPVPLDDGTIVTADDRYIHDSILLPRKQVAAGYPNIMPTFSNLLDEGDVMKLVAYIKSMAAERGSPP